MTTTWWVGSIGVRPASTTKVTAAEISASATAIEPTTRDDSRGAEASVDSSEIATSSALVIATLDSRRTQPKAADARVTAARLAQVSLMHLYNNVAELRQIRGAMQAVQRICR